MTNLTKEQEKRSEKKECGSCKKENHTTKTRKVKENGVVGYYDVNVVWCDNCVNSHNRYLLSTWG